MTEVREWEQVRTDATASLIAAAADHDGNGLVMGNAAQLADAVLAVCDEEATNRMAEQFVAESRFRALQVREGKIELEAGPAREIAAMWLGAVRTLLKGAENYSEIEMEFKPAGGVERYAFTAQRVGKLTPHQARRAAEGALAKVRKVHRRSNLSDHCVNCRFAWPCPTIQAVGGEEITGAPGPGAGITP